jgi:hypothetical protein
MPAKRGGVGAKRVIVVALLGPGLSLVGSNPSAVWSVLNKKWGKKWIPALAEDHA